MKTNISYTGTIHKAEDERFRWNFTSPSGLLDKKKGRMIYQMAWLKKTEHGSDDVDDETRKLVLQFFVDLEIAKKQAKADIANTMQPDPDPDPGAQEPCPRCGSYCYGDCKANE